MFLAPSPVSEVKKQGLRYSWPRGFRGNRENDTREHCCGGSDRASGTATAGMPLRRTRAAGASGAHFLVPISRSPRAAAWRRTWQARSALPPGGCGKAHRDVGSSAPHAPQGLGGYVVWGDDGRSDKTPDLANPKLDVFSAGPEPPWPILCSNLCFCLRRSGPFGSLRSFVCNSKASLVLGDLGAAFGARLGGLRHLPVTPDTGRRGARRARPSPLPRSSG